MTRILIWLVRGYQYLLSPWLAAAAVLPPPVPTMPARRCPGMVVAWRLANDPSSATLPPWHPAATTPSRSYNENHMDTSAYPVRHFFSFHPHAVGGMAARSCRAISTAGSIHSDDQRCRHTASGYCATCCRSGNRFTLQRGERIHVRTDLIDAEIDTMGGDLRHLELLKHRDSEDKRKNSYCSTTAPGLRLRRPIRADRYRPALAQGTVCLPGTRLCSAAGTGQAGSSSELE